MICNNSPLPWKEGSHGSPENRSSHFGNHCNIDDQRHRVKSDNDHRTLFSANGSNLSRMACFAQLITGRRALITRNERIKLSNRTLASSQRAYARPTFDLLLHWVALFVGMTGDVVLDYNTDRIMDYNVWYLPKGQLQYQRHMIVQMSGARINATPCSEWVVGTAIIIVLILS